MADLRAIPTLFLNGSVDLPTIEAIERHMALADLPPDHATIWVDTVDTSAHVEIEYGIGAARVHVEADAATPIAASEACLAELVARVAALL
jgi:hypothetical protein